ncbi:MAG TPA: hypothetical protein VLH10_19130 [Yinghuangia sp.]|uniref:hypothetical protein n=1 Tax=Yinghuangia sp. YIM S10712 TaxID=3436930 RepID=UPI002CCAF438|nr:hypothetical protein [Yinghuangia sp.]
MTPGRNKGIEAAPRRRPYHGEVLREWTKAWREDRRHGEGGTAADAVDELPGTLAPVLLVAASTAADAVRFAGGLMFDRASLGWRVTVVTMDGSAPGCQALPILGATACGRSAGDPPHTSARLPRAVAVASGLYEHEERMRRWVRSSADDNAVEIRFWDSRRAAAGEDTGRDDCHRLSLAARAFKAQALAAVGAPRECCGSVEVFRCTYNS